MKTLFLLLLSVSVLSLDLCNEYQNYEDCIQSTDSQCKWDPNLHFCKHTTEFLDGCLNLLNAKACAKQLGYASGELAVCRFLNRCEPVPDLLTEKCSSKLSKHACLSILNPSQLCYWDIREYRCFELPGNENYEKNFPTALYSASVCSHIESYFVMHSSVIWPLLNYKPNLVKQAQNQFRFDLFLDVESDGTRYEDDATLPKNNFVNANGDFVPYIVGQPLASAASNLRISDRKREGCIALQIQDDSDFESLMINFSGMLYGVNHIYCRYLYESTKNQAISVFTNGGCMKVNNILDLTRPTFVTQNSLNCKSVGYKLCSFIKSSPDNCEVVTKFKLYPCQQKSATVPLPSTYDCTNPADGMYYICRLNEKCFLDISTQQCRKIDVSFEDCKRQTSTYIIRSEITADMTNFQYCAPKHMCNTPGIGKWYCQNIPYLCAWNNANRECSEVFNYQIKTMKCNEATSKYTCASLTLYNQLCIWLDPDQLCINVVENPLFVEFYAFPTQSVVNRNLCVNYKENSYKYNQVTKQCTLVADISTYTCATAVDVNKYFCLSLSLCVWNEKTSQCSALPSTTKPCADLKNVSRNACSQLATAVPGSFCTYTYPNCLVLTTIACDTQGLSEAQCLAISSNDNYCRWFKGACTRISVNYLSSENCYAFQKVNPTVCISHNFSKQPCAYDQTNNSCYSTIVPSATCSNLLNAYACQLSSAECYFYEGCKSATDYSFLTCEGLFVSKSVCLKISKAGQPCYFDTACRKLDFIPNDCAALGNKANALACQSLQVSDSKVLDTGNYCEYVTNQCVGLATLLADCGTNRKINTHQCSGFTTGNCFFEDLTCKTLDPASRLGQYKLSKVSCPNVNVSLCTKVTSMGCRTVSVQYSTVLVDKRCGVYLQTDSLCATLQALGSIVNPNTCALATTKCLYNGTNCADPPNSTTFYKCDHPGLSRELCISQTYGKCMFYNKRCQAADEFQECTIRNKQACLHSGVLKCIFKAEMCLNSVEECDTNDRNTAPVTYSWSVCSTSTSACFGRGGACVKGSRALSCDIPGINRTVCLDSTSVQNCQYVNNRCMKVSTKSCERTLTKDECAQSQVGNCVFDNGVCYTQDQIELCDRYEYTNYKYCRQFPKCIYFGQKCINQSVILDQMKYQAKPPAVLTCNIFTTKPDCIMQLHQNCEWVSNACATSTPASCPHLSSDQYSKYACMKNTGCKFNITKQGGGYCYNVDNYACEQMGESVCLSDISDAYKCYWNGVACLTANQTTCASVATVRMNYAACLAIAALDSNLCSYQFETNFCKVKDYPSSVCTDASNQYNINCAMMIKSACILTDIGSGNHSCTNAAVNTYNIQLNKYGCVNLTAGNYYYDDSRFECVDATTYLTKLRACVNLNKNGCISQTSQLGFLCQWTTEGCIDLTKQEAAALASCLDLNQVACQNVEKTDCRWNGTACVAAALGTHGCAIAAQTYSLGACATANQACIAKADNTGCDALAETVPACEGFGLSNLSCLTMTSAFCKWAGYCTTANLRTTLCSETVSSITCQAIITPGQYCRWNGSACQAFIPNTCQEANSKHSCQNVLNENCSYDDFKNICNKLEVIPQQCLSNYSKSTCRNAQSIVCIWQGDKCQVLETVAACNQIFNQHACLYSSLFCVWQNNTCLAYDKADGTDLVLCKDMVVGANQKVCNSFKKDYCEFRDHKCGMIISTFSDPNTQLKLADSAPYAKLFLTGWCSQQTTQLDCLRTKLPSQACLWISNACSTVTDFNQPCQILNEFACPKSLKNCIWRNEQCISDDGMIIEDTYDDTSPLIFCDTSNISKKTCLKLQTGLCIFNSNKCSNFSSASVLQSCAQYQQVNKKVCEAIDHIACDYDAVNNNCRAATEDDTLSRLACISQSKKRTYWRNGTCVTISGSFKCESEYQSNPTSCSDTFELTPCGYDEEALKCTTAINLISLKCDSPGLNFYACVNITSQPCIFSNGKCQLFNQFDLKCDQVRNVNSVACQYIQADQCQYDLLNQQCIQITTAIPCSTTGLNQKGCLLNSQCKWSPDYMQCICGLQTVVFQCSQRQDRIVCEADGKCQFGVLGCKPKVCEDFTATECPKPACYVNKRKACKSAKRCEDIINVEPAICGSYFFGGNACISAGTRCVTFNNYDLSCPVSDCLNSNCILQQTCQAKQCTDRQPKDCETSNCAIFNGTCTEVKSCQQFNEDATTCQITRIAGNQCNYQKFNIYQNSQVCTSQPCLIYGSSFSLCHGNEMGPFTCLLDNNLQCKACEQITDQCACTEALGTCSWQMGRCASVQCQSFSNQASCISLARCQWSEAQKLCLIHCNKIISQDICDARSGECYYNKLTNFCESGTLAEPDLSIKVDIQVIFGTILLLPLLGLVSY